VENKLTIAHTSTLPDTIKLNKQSAYSPSILCASSDVLLSPGISECGFRNAISSSAWKLQLEQTARNLLSYKLCIFVIDTCTLLLFRTHYR